MLLFPHHDRQGSLQLILLSLFAFTRNSLQVHATNNQTETLLNSGNPNPPNLIILYTDEQNFRTIGAYRSVLQSINATQSHIWGLDTIVPTPNIDSLATGGAIYTNMYTPIPMCTPSRTAFLTGLYPHFTRTGASANHERLNDGLTSFAHYLSDNDYQTAFLGKWHLDGDPKPGWAYEYNEQERINRSFGFQEQGYKFNRGHWKFFTERKGEGGNTTIIKAFPWEKRRKFVNKPDNYATDFLFERGLKFIKNRIRREEKFAVMMSILGASFMLFHCWGRTRFSSISKS